MKWHGQQLVCQIVSQSGNMTLPFVGAMLGHISILVHRVGAPQIVPFPSLWIASSGVITIRFVFQYETLCKTQNAWATALWTRFQCAWSETMDREGSTWEIRTWAAGRIWKARFKIWNQKMVLDKAAVHVVKHWGNLPNIQYDKKLGLGRGSGLPLFNQPCWKSFCIIWVGNAAVDDVVLSPPLFQGHLTWICHCHHGFLLLRAQTLHSFGLLIISPEIDRMVSIRGEQHWENRFKKLDPPIITSAAIAKEQYSSHRNRTGISSQWWTTLGSWWPGSGWGAHHIDSVHSL